MEATPVKGGGDSPTVGRASTSFAAADNLPADLVEVPSILEFPSPEGEELEKTIPEAFGHPNGAAQAAQVTSSGPIDWGEGLNQNLSLCELELRLGEQLEEALEKRLGSRLTGTVVDLAEKHPDLSICDLLELGQQSETRAVLEHGASRELMLYRLDIKAEDLSELSAQLGHSMGEKAGLAYGKAIEAMRSRPHLHPRDLEPAASSRGLSTQERFDCFVSQLEMKGEPRSRQLPSPGSAED